MTEMCDRLRRIMDSWCLHAKVTHAYPGMAFRYFHKIEGKRFMAHDYLWDVLPVWAWHGRKFKKNMEAVVIFAYPINRSGCRLVLANCNHGYFFRTNSNKRFHKLQLYPI